MCGWFCRAVLQLGMVAISALTAQSFVAIQPSRQSLNKPIVSVFALGLCSCSTRVWQRWIGGEPEPNEQRQRFVADLDGMLQVVHLADDSIDASAECRLHSFRSIW